MDLFGNTKEDILNDYFNFWRKKGYPNYKKENYNKKNELIALINFDEKNILKNNILKQTMHSCGFLWTYFPHWIEVEYGNQETIKNLWYDDEKLKKLLKKTYEYECKYGNGNITTNRLRQNSKVYLSKQSVSNFRPTVAKYIYNTYGNNGAVYDMSCGWGGRLFGFLSSNCKKYIGVEPSIKTFTGLKELNNDFPSNKIIELHNLGSEVFIPKKNSLDLCFTSPPYFNTEKYSNEKTQSYIKYPTIEKWLNGFLKKTFENCFFGLKENRFMIVNIANISKSSLENETIKIAENIGFKLVETLKLELSSISGKGAKYEPIFIFKKD